MVQVQELVQGSDTSLGVTFEQPDIEWCRCRSWYRGAVPAWVLPLSSQILSGAGAGAGTGAALPANTMTASTIRNSAACPRNSNEEQ